MMSKRYATLGYGGNDNGLMKILGDELKNVPQANLYWCYRGEDKPDLAHLTDKCHKQIKLVQTQGFDEFMLNLNQALGYKTLSNKIADIATERQKRYDEQLARLRETTKGTESSEAVKELVAETWWEVQVAVDNTEDVEEKDRLYQQGLQKFPNSHKLMGNYAIFLETKEPADLDESEKYYLKALELAPEHANINCNYAIFLHKLRQEYEQAEACYLRALTSEPEHANTNCSYAIFLANIRNDVVKAGDYHRKAVELNPKDADFNIGYATFLMDKLRKYEEAERYFKTALELNPDDMDTMISFAELYLQQGRFAEAETYLVRAQEQNTEPKYLLVLAFYHLALFPDYYQKSKDLLHELLEQGHTYPSWDFSGIIEQAEKQGNTKIAELQRLADRIDGK